MMSPVESQLQAALDEGERFEALALVHLNTDQLLFLKTAEGSADGMQPAVENFMLRAVTNTEALEELQEDHEAVFYDLEQRQIILSRFKTKKGRYLLTAVVSPQKTYKQSLKRLIKSIKTIL